MPVGGGTPRRIQTPGNESSVEWSPDSRWITFTSGNGLGTNTHVYAADVSTLATKNLTTGLRMEPGGVAWQRADEALVQLTLGGRNALYRDQFEDRRSQGDCRRPPAPGGIHLRHRALEGRVRRHEHGLADRALSQRSDRRGARTSADELQREPEQGDRLVAERAVHVQVGRRRRDRGLARQAVRLRGRQEVSAGALHSWRPAFGLQRGLVRRVPEPRRRRHVGALHESARLERLRRRVQQHDPQPLGRRGLHGPDEGRGPRHRAGPTSTRRASASPAARTAAS